jgi:hypothetical protein
MKLCGKSHTSAIVARRVSESSGASHSQYDCQANSGAAGRRPCGRICCIVPISAYQSDHMRARIRPSRFLPAPSIEVFLTIGAEQPRKLTTVLNGPGLPLGVAYAQQPGCSCGVPRRGTVP